MIRAKCSGAFADVILNGILSWGCMLRESVGVVWTGQYAEMSEAKWLLYGLGKDCVECVFEENSF